MGAQPESKSKVNLKEKDPDEDVFRTRYAAAADSVIRGSPLNRGDRLAEQGTMVKAAGASQNRGQFTVNRGQPAGKTAKEKQALTQWRYAVNGALPGR